MRIKLKAKRRRQIRDQAAPIEPSAVKEFKPLFLILKKYYFEQILAGKKNEEYRDNTEFYRARLLTENGQKYRNFTHVLFQEGYSPDARKMIVEINKIELRREFIIHLGQITSRNF